MTETDDKENILNYYNHPNYQKSVKVHEPDEEDDDLGCVTLSESEDEDETGAGVTEEFLNQAEKCLMDIERFETEEEVKMKLINILYQHIQLQRQGPSGSVPITYDLLKKCITVENEEELPRKDSIESELLDPAYFQPFEENCSDDEEDKEIENIFNEVCNDYEPEECKINEPTNPDEMIIKPKKTFEELLAEELKKEEAMKIQEKEEVDRQLMPPPPLITPKRTFLKRGEGIARFNNPPVRKPPTKHKPKQESQPKRTIGMIKSVSSDKPKSTNKLPSKVKLEGPITASRDPVKSVRSKPVMSPIRQSPTNSPTRSSQPSLSQRLKANSAMRTNSPRSIPDGQNLQPAAVEISGFLKPEELEERLAAEEEELEEFRMLEQAAADKSINSLIGMIKLGGSERPGVETIVENETWEEEEEEDNKEELEDDFDDCETWGFRTPTKQQSLENVNGLLKEHSNLQEINQDAHVPPSKLLGALFPGLRPPAPAPIPKTEEQKPDEESEKLKSELKTKLSELEKEVARFQQEAAALARARAEKESELRKLREENDKYVEDLETREGKFQEYKDRELKMLRAEKKQFEMTQLSARQRAAKLELVDGLTERVKSLEEELERKEKTWNSTFTRLKNKAENKEKECDDLHQQIKIMEQEKLASWEKEVIRSSNRRHKHCQTAPPPEHIKTEGLPTPSSTTKPALVARHPDLADIIDDKQSVRFCEPKYENLVKIPGNNSRNGVKEAEKNIEVRPADDYVVIVDERAAKGQRKGSERATDLPSCPERVNSPSNGGKGGVEAIGPDGSVTVKYSNGTVKHISADGRVVTMTYFNGDTKKTLHDGRVIYSFLKDGITQTQLPDGTEKTVFPTGQEETKYQDGRVEIKYPDNSTKVTFLNGEEKSVYADGTVVSLDKTGQRLILLPNGQREIHTGSFKRREYPDGTSKTVYNDGRQETIHSNGRIRKKDPKGNLISDVIIDSTGKILHNYLAKSRL